MGKALYQIPTFKLKALARYPIVKIHKSFFGFFWFFWGVGVVQFFSKFRIPSRMILVNSVRNLKSVAPKLQKLSHRKVSINVAHRRRTTTNDARHQPGKTYNLVEMKFRRDKKKRKKEEKEKTRPYTRQHQSRAVGQGQYSS